MRLLCSCAERIPLGPSWFVRPAHEPSRTSVMTVARTTSFGGLPPNEFRMASAFEPSRYPAAIATVYHCEPAPRRIRGYAGGRLVFDTTRALYVWEWANYPQYYVPASDVAFDLLVLRDGVAKLPQGDVRRYDLRAGADLRANAARRVETSSIAALIECVRFAWDALDQWFEEDEEVFVHPRNPYTRVDALRSRRTVRVELDGVVLAESSAPVMVFETGLPTRYYVDQRDVRWEMLVPSSTRTACPYKGRTTAYWSLSAGDTTVADAAWSYTFPTRQLLPIAGLVAFLNEKVDVCIDGVAQERPITHMS